MNLENWKGWVNSAFEQIGIDIKALRNDKLDKTQAANQIDTLLGNSDWRTQISAEQVQDIIGAMVQSGTHENISITYDDTNGVLNFTGTAGSGGSTLTQEEVEDIVGGVATQGTGINVFYDDANNALVVSLSGESFTTAHKNKLEGIQANAQVNSITGVKGSAESTYRTGEVNITLANLDAGTADPLTAYTTARDS